MTDLKINGATVEEIELEPLKPIPTGADGPIATRGIETWRTPGGKVGTGVWECDAGRFRADFGEGGEFMHVISGAVTCTADDGTVTELRPGDSMTFTTGWAGEWDVTARLRKLYVTFIAE